MNKYAVVFTITSEEERGDIVKPNIITNNIEIFAESFEDVLSQITDSISYYEGEVELLKVNKILINN